MQLRVKQVVVNPEVRHPRPQAFFVTRGSCFNEAGVVRSTIPLHRLAHQTPLGCVTKKEARVAQLISLVSGLVMDLFLEGPPITPFDSLRDVFCHSSPGS